MKELIKSVKEFKIIPSNFKSAGSFKVLDITDSEFSAELSLIDNNELADYKPGSSVEIFGVNNKGLVYFQTKILSISNNVVKLAMTQDYSIIQRREYSRVTLKQGKIEFVDIADNAVKEVCDISAGGARFISNSEFDPDKMYDIKITLSNNMVISCKFQPVRISKQTDNTYDVSGKFTDLENVDRIILVQYTFKIKMEDKNKEDN